MASPPLAALTAAIQQAVASSEAAGDPFTTWKRWATWSINGVTCPGVIAKGRFRGFERETRWDLKRGKGQAFATLTRITLHNAAGAFTNLLWTASQWAAWDIMVTDVLLYAPTKESATSALVVDYPELALLNIINVVVHKVHPRRHLGGNLWEGTIELIEWTAPPKTSIVSTPLKADTTPIAPLPGSPPPAVAAAHAAYVQSQANHAAAQGAP